MELGKFEILEELGRGGFGTVYKARDKALNRLVAIKVLHPNLVNDPAFLGRFRQEAQIAANLDHPNLVPVYDYGEDEGRYFIVMGYMPGGSLKDLLKNKGSLTKERALEILQQISAGLAYAHKKGVIHRDLKPGNILFDDEGKARVSDMGFAKILQSDSSMSMSTSGGLVGTPAYMAPEIWKGEASTAAVDVYSSACILVEMLTGKPLFDGDSTPVVILKHLQPVNLPETLPEGWKPVISRALEKEPGKRFESVEQLVREIRHTDEKVLVDKIDEKDSHLHTNDLQEEVQNPDQPSSVVGKEHFQSHDLISEETQKSSLGFEGEKRGVSQNKTPLYLGLGILVLLVVFLIVRSGIFSARPQSTVEPEVVMVQETATRKPYPTPITVQEMQPVDATPAQADGDLSVGIVLPNLDEPYWIQIGTQFKKLLTQQGYVVEVLSSQFDTNIEMQNVKTLLSKGIKVLIICPHDGTAAAAAVEAAHDAGVKVISFEHPIFGFGTVDYFVKFSQFSIGAAQAQYLVEKATGTGNPLYLYAGAISDESALEFFGSAWEVLQPKIVDGTFVIKNSSEAVALKDKATLTRGEMGKILGQITTNWDFNVAKGLAEANLNAATVRDKGEVFILAPNDGTARPIADAFSADKDVTRYYVTGQDAEKDSIQYIIDGKQSMTVLKDFRTLVEDAVAAAIAFLNGQTPEANSEFHYSDYMTPLKESDLVIVTQNNVKATIFDSGYYPASDFSGLK